MLLIGLVSAASADERGRLAEKSRELGAVQERIKRLQKVIGGLDAQKDGLTGQLAALETEYGRLAEAARAMEAKIRNTGQETEQLRQHRDRIRQRVVDHNQALVGQVRSAYALGRQDWLKLLMNQEDAVASGRVLTYYRYINRARAAQLQSLGRDLDEARAVEDALQAKMRGLEDSRAELDRKRARLDQSKTEREALLAALERERKDKSTRLLQLNEDASRLQSLIAALPEADAEVPESASEAEISPSGPAAPAEAKGRLGWPVAGDLRQRFGAPRMSGSWDGVLIAAREGDTVRAVAAGRVAFADWLRGYGLLTIIDHGNGLMSLYAYNQSLQRDVGDWVDAGEVVSRVGSSGGQSEPALYFGLRDKGRPIDPLAWCARNE
ncbi:MAG: peptidase M23 [Methylococcaceae bacterium]|nr:peptidase M23 [Methylococcaceae bacterium]